MQNDELLEKTASERLTLDEEYQMQQKWFNDEDSKTFHPSIINKTFLLLSKTQFYKNV